MDKAEISRRLDSAVDELAAIEHERWAHWQAYMHNAGEKLADGRLILPAEQVARWERQIATRFKDLDLSEQESDREQVRRYLPLVLATLAGEDVDAGS